MPNPPPPPPPTAAERRADLIAQFVRTRPSYYQNAFAKLGAKTGWVWTFNLAACLLGPAWFGMRGLWKWGLPFVIAESFALVQILRGWWGDLSSEAKDRIAAIQNTLDLRQRQLAAAIENESDKVAALQNWITALQTEITAIHADIAAQQDRGLWVALSGAALLAAVKTAQGFLANPLLEKRFSDWLSNRAIARGMTPVTIAAAAGFVIFIFAIAVAHYGFGAGAAVLAQFPTDPAYRTHAIQLIVDFFAWLTATSAGLFYGISVAIRTCLDYLELLFVDTPWPIVAAFIVLLTHLTAGPRGALFAAASLAFIGAFQFWEKAMTTLALLGTAACISIGIGVPLGVFCARRPRFYNCIRPIMDFMQTMPSFVFMIPVIALFSVGKPAAIVITMIFGGTPVVRLTVLGMRGVPAAVREAAIAFGASNWYLLTRIDLPLAAPSILAGVNQTIMLSLAMVVVASLIGAKGLGEDVLEALQYANVGQGILAGFAILFCAMILNRIIQGGAQK